MCICNVGLIFVFNILILHSLFTVLLFSLNIYRALNLIYTDRWIQRIRNLFIILLLFGRILIGITLFEERIYYQMFLFAAGKVTATAECNCLTSHLAFSGLD